MSDVQIYYGSDVTPVSSDEISIDLMGKTVTIKNGLAANTGRTVQFTKTASFGKPNSRNDQCQFLCISYTGRYEESGSSR